MSRVTREYFIPLPIKYKDYLKAQQYTVYHMSISETSDNDAKITVHENIKLTEEYSNSTDNQLHKEIYSKYPNCIYTKKLFEFGSKVPGVLTIFLPTKMFTAFEHSYYTFPKCETYYESCYFDKNKHTIAVLSDHEKGFASLKNEKTLQIIKKNTEYFEAKKKIKPSKTEIEVIDIYEKTEDKELNEALNDLQPNWLQKALESNDEYILLRKVVDVEIIKWGLGSVPEIIQKEMRNILLKASKNILRFRSKWENMTEEEIQKLNKSSITQVTKEE
ncbi:Membrane-associated phosphatidylinositol transfer protein 2 [Cucumispora dikerogammari]|nr:Membrane-associated phosphatidylinositol transfer protein 2 [Cucumispora dikerogammari]